MESCDAMKPLLMGMMDGELTAEQAAEVTRHLNRCRHCREEFDSLRQACDPLHDLAFEELDDALAERLWKAPFSRFTRNASLVLILVSWLALLAVAVIEMARDPSVDTIAKLAVLGLILGLVVLFANVLVQRLHTARNDPYKEVEQ